jgi:hypothetical protein
MRFIDTVIKDSSFIKVDTPNVEEHAKRDIASLVELNMQRPLIVVSMDRVHVFALLVADSTVNPYFARDCLLLPLNEDFQRHVIMPGQAGVIEALKGQWVWLIGTGPD